MDLDQIQVKISLNKSNALVAFTFSLNLRLVTYYLSFLPHEAMLSAVFAVVVCLCVCVCVCHTPVLYQNG